VVVTTKIDEIPPHKQCDGQTLFMQTLFIYILLYFVDLVDLAATATAACWSPPAFQNFLEGIDITSLHIFVPLTQGFPLMLEMSSSKVVSCIVEGLHQRKSSLFFLSLVNDQVQDNPSSLPVLLDQFTMPRGSVGSHK
jgi:hypothetical protein